MRLNGELRKQCQYFLSGHLPLTQREWLAKLAESPLAELPADRYGSGPAIARLEQEVATLLGKEAAVFVHKGVTAQQMALRVWSDRQRSPNIVLHPRSHIDQDEANAYERLHNLAGIRIGSLHQPFTVEELAKVSGPLGAVTVELPLRRAGFKLPSWDELTAISQWCREHSVPLHFDGARLWESAPYYGRSYAEIAALADSVYVSFYKGLGGLSGCVLAGSRDFIAETNPWQVRMGGSLYTVFPYILSAYEGLQTELPRMAEYHERTKEIAAALIGLPGLTITPNPPQATAFQVYIQGQPEQIMQALHKVAASQQIWLFDWLDETAQPDWLVGELQVGAATQQITTEQITAAFVELTDLIQTEIF